MFSIQRTYLLLAFVIFLIEVFIAVYVHDAFVRPYIGDVLVVIMLYCFVKGFMRIAVKSAAIGVLLFALLIEGLQYFKVVHLLGLQHNAIASTIIGTTFAWHDVVAYVVGIGTVLAAEKWKGSFMRTPKHSLKNIPSKH